jgi:hypothetical protein
MARVALGDEMYLGLSLGKSMYWGINCPNSGHWVRPEWRGPVTASVTRHGI